MFDMVHGNKRIVQVILALIILPFALWGINSYDNSGNSSDVVATLNGIKITQQELDNSLREQQNRMRQEMGANYDSTMFDKPGIRQAILDNLVTRHLLIDRAQAVKLIVSDNEIAQVIGGVEAFQEGGKFNKQLYASVLASNNMSPMIYEKRLRDELIGQKLQETYSLNGFAPTAVAENIFQLNGEQRIVRTAAISLHDATSQVKVEEAEIKKYYDQNQSEFHVPEQAKVEYVRLSMENLLGKAEVHKEDVRKYYDEHQNEMGTPEERRAAHILITIAAGASQAERDATKAKAEALLKQVRETPARFSELAKQNSQDPGSASDGGDLGFFGRGMMVKPFEESAYGLKIGEISGLVQSEFGYHIIKLLAIKPSQVPPFDEVREDIANKLRQQMASDMFAEMAEKFSNTVYEQSDTLKTAADLVGAKIEQSGWLVKGEASTSPWTAKMLQAIFSDEVVKSKRNTAAIEVATNEMVAARIMQYKPASVRALSEVQGTIRQKLINRQALALAAKKGASLLEQLQRGDKPKLSWGPAQTLTRLKHGSLDASLVKQVFQVNAKGLPRYVGAEDAQKGYLLVRIDSVKESEAISDANRVQYVQQLRQLTGDEVFQAFLANEKQQAKIKVNLIDKVAE